MEVEDENMMECIPPGLNDECLLSRVQLFATPRTPRPQVPLFMGFSGKNTGMCYAFPFPNHQELEIVGSRQSLCKDFTLKRYQSN